METIFACFKTLFFASILVSPGECLVIKGLQKLRISFDSHKYPPFTTNITPSSLPSAKIPVTSPLVVKFAKKSQICHKIFLEWTQIVHFRVLYYSISNTPGDFYEKRKQNRS
jgi:hypothetical protein